MKCKIIDILKNRFDTIKCYVKKHIPKRCGYFLVTYIYLEGVRKIPENNELLYW